MGCCHVIGNKETSSLTPDSVKIFQAISTNSSRRLNSLLSYFKRISSIEEFDLILIPYESYSVNALCICFLYNYTELFKILLSHNSSLSLLDDQLSTLNICPLHYLSSKGYVGILKLYFPHYQSISSKDSLLSSTLAYTSSLFSQFRTFPIHTAAHYGNLNIIDFFYQTHSELLYTPAEFDINSLEDSTGENCALIACREGHYKIVKYLFERCKADFFIVNDRKENSIMVAVAGMKRSGALEYLDVIEYLIEVVGVDVKYMYEEALIMAQDPRLVEYIEQQLKQKGVHTSKIDLEKGLPKFVRGGQEETNKTDSVVFKNSASYT